MAIRKVLQNNELRATPTRQTVIDSVFQTGVYSCPLLATIPRRINSLPTINANGFAACRPPDRSTHDAYGRG